MRQLRRGFTMMELLIAIALFTIIFSFIFVNWKAQIQKGFDSKRKSDLVTLRNAFENYFNDRGCYPPSTMLLSCGGSDLQKWGLRIVPCDPETKQPFDYQPVNGDPCQGYRIYTQLKITSDGDIGRIGCGAGCGPGGIYNYGVSSGAPVGEILPPALPPAPGNIYACVHPPGCDNVGYVACAGTKYLTMNDCNNSCPPIAGSAIICN